MTSFDAIVIGTGVTGQTVAAGLARGGLRVAVADRREFGGTCLLRGCEAKKVLYSAAEVVERAADQRGNGIEGSLRLDWPALLAFKRTFTDPAPAGVEASLTDVGAVALHGEARFVGAATLAIGGESYEAGHIVIATGARPVPLGIPGEELVVTSERFLAAEQIGARIVFIGGGYISFEFAHIASAAGAAVTICNRGPRPLVGFDPDLVALLVAAYASRGIEVLTSAAVAAVERSGDALAVMLADGRRLPADMVVHGAGRVPDLDALDLPAAGVRFGPLGIEVDGSLRSTTNPRVWAAGDAAARGLPLTPVGVSQGHVLAGNILGSRDTVFDPGAIPSVVFSHPPLAAIGLTERGAGEEERTVTVRLHDQTPWASARRVGARAAGAKVLVEESSDRVVGAHLLGEHADEMINVFAAAMAGGLTAAQLRGLIWAYPTGGWEIVHLL